MRKLILIVVLTYLAIWSKAQIIADHTVVDQYDQIPQEYIEIVKSMLVSIPGESHSRGYRLGVELLEELDNTFQVEVFDGTPLGESTQYLRLGRHKIAGEDIFFSQAGIEEIKDDISDQHSTGNPFDVMGFGWCWDMSLGDDPGGGLDPVYLVHWAGRSVGSPEGSMRWGLDAEDQALTGNSVSMDTYLDAIASYNQHSIDNSISTKWIFTTGTVERPENAGSEAGFQREIKHDYIRAHVAEDANRVLFDYADILCWNNEGEQYLTDWDDGGDIRPHAQIHPDNMMDYNNSWELIPQTSDGDHIGEVGALRLGKAMWWLLARMAGWGADVSVIDIQIYCTGDTSVVTGGDLQMYAAVLPGNATNTDIEWSVIQGDGTASISSEGLLRGGQPGEVRVVARALDNSGVADTLTVPILDPPVPVSSIFIESAGGINEINEGESLQCSAQVLPPNASNPTVLWSIENQTGTASIDAEGLVQVLTAGTVEVIATAEDGSLVADSFQINIVEGLVQVTDITISSDGGLTSLESGSTLQFSAEVLPVNASNPNITWSVTNGTGTATMSASGLLTAGNPGTVTIAASAQDGSGVNDYFDITVLPQVILVESIAIASAGGATSLEAGSTLQFSAEVLPVNASNPNITWSVTNGTGTATISASGLLTAGNPGTVTISASAQDGSGVNDYFDITVLPQVILVESIAIASTGGATSLESGSTLQFSAEVLPLNATNREVTWSVINLTGTATITTGGLLIGGNPGTVAIVATARDGSGIADTINITVRPSLVLVESIDISTEGNVTNLVSGSVLQFYAEVLPANANNPAVAWSVIDGTGTTTITSGGLLTAGVPGAVTIVATALDGSGVADMFYLSITSPTILVESIAISSAGGITSLVSGSTLQFTATVYPSDASHQSIAWSVSNGSGSATISQTGLLTAGNPGTVQVLAIALDGSGTSTYFPLSIAAPAVPISSIVIIPDGGISELESGWTLQFSASIFPEDASSKAIAWTVIELTGTADINSNGLLTAGNPGEVEVVASALDGSGVTDNYVLNILPGDISVSSIEVTSAGNVSILETGEKLQLYATVNPSNANNTGVYWHVTSSGGDPVGSITADGMFIALGEGEVDALAIAQDGSGVYGTMSLTVLGPTGGKTFEQTQINVYPNPGSGNFFLQLGNIQAKIIRVLNVHGAIVLEQVPEPGNPLVELDLSLQEPGIYYIQVYSDMDLLVKPVILSR